jgi:serine/threonine protein kinase
MEIVESSETFKTINGKFQFYCVKGIVRQDNVLYSAKWKDRRQKPFDISQLYDVQQLETIDKAPKMRADWTVVPGFDCYIKTPSLFEYCGSHDIEKRILREVETCEVLRKHPHPNIASYYGCRETRGRVSGICFKQYTSTLAERVNPQHLNKSTFLLSSRPLVSDAMKERLGGILDGIQHLHSLGLVHNDITPSNIMLDDDGTLVLIDFDSCRKVGELLCETETKRTHGWHDPDVKTVSERNDLDAFLELRTWLFGSSVDQFLFT